MAFKFEKDKKKHFIVGIPLGIMLQFLCAYFFPLQPAFASITCFLLLVAGCYGFELFSKVTGKGHAENLDAIAGIFGGIIGMAICWCILRYLMFGEFL